MLHFLRKYVLLSVATLLFPALAEDVAPIRPDWDQANEDPARIAPYTLEDPLAFADGTRLTSAKQWPKRRAEILDIFAREMYGQEPPKPEAFVTELMFFKNKALGGFGIISQYRMWFKADKTGPAINWFLFRPYHAKGPVPVILILTYAGTSALIPDPDIAVSDGWVHWGNHKVSDKNRGSQCNPNSATVFPIGTLLAKGYAVLTAAYGEISPDPLPDESEPNPNLRQDAMAYQGVFRLWGKRDESRTDNPTALGAWAWGLSRGLDLAERIPELDAKRSVVTGCSRLGKAALLAAARDERFAVCVPVQCGGGGVRLAKRDYGENVGTQMRMFKHWYCKAYAKYARNPARLLTFDQHLLLASIAPRHVLVEGFSPSVWMDTEGEYLACKAASPAWEFLGYQGLPGKGYPDTYDESAIGTHLGYVRRTEEHGISAYDWNWLLEFADQAFGK